MTTNYYIDGFNFYYGAVRGTSYKWLDFSALFQQLFPNNTIGRIRYFTAPVKAREPDLEQPLRQQAYLRALGTLPSLSIHQGHFLTRRDRMPLVSDPSQRVQVWRTEEKESDVNLATYLLLDAFDDEYDTAILVSNDSDFVHPVEVVRKRFQKKVGILNPQQRGISWALRNAADFYKQPIRPGVLASSQFPPTLTDRHGTTSKPQSW